tara:strand:+ start:212 stop:460 length:249 start_codon:yes stop_codon:yes gene_type:complete
MKSIFEKEKKLNDVLDRLNTLEMNNPRLYKEIENLDHQKNQLIIEKKDLEKKHNSLREDYEKLRAMIEEMNQVKSDEKKKGN